MGRRITRSSLILPGTIHICTYLAPTLHPVDIHLPLTIRVNGFYDVFGGHNLHSTRIALSSSRPLSLRLPMRPFIVWFLYPDHPLSVCCPSYMMTATVVTTWRKRNNSRFRVITWRFRSCRSVSLEEFSYRDFLSDSELSPDSYLQWVHAKIPCTSEYGPRLGCLRARHVVSSGTSCVSTITSPPRNSTPWHLSVSMFACKHTSSRHSTFRRTPTRS